MLNHFELDITISLIVCYYSASIVIVLIDIASVVVGK